MKYQLYGRTSHTEPFSRHLGMKLVYGAIGAGIGFYAGAMVVIAEIQHSVPVISQGTPSSLQVTQATPLHDLSVQPQAVTSFNQLSEPSDVQPSLGYVFVQYGQGDSVVQPAKTVYAVQPTERYGNFQHTVTDYQMQGEQLTLN